MRIRHLGLRGLVRLRVRAGRPIASKSVAHRLFLRELREYRECLEPALALEGHAAPEVRLLADSYRESADMSLERAIEALACAYEPRPLFGVYERLRSGDRAAASPALDYLSALLPRGVFKIVARLFEHGRSAPRRGADARDLGAWIRHALTSNDAWLRACAVRAARIAREPGLSPIVAPVRVPPELWALTEEARIANASSASPLAGTGTESC